MKADAKDWAQKALHVQNACNLSGVIHSFSQMMTQLREACPEKGTDWYNTHPLCVLFSDKTVSLTGVQGFPDEASLLWNATKWCNDTAEGKRPNDFEV